MDMYHVNAAMHLKKQFIHNHFSSECGTTFGFNVPDHVVDEQYQFLLQEIDSKMLFKTYFFWGEYYLEILHYLQDDFKPRVIVSDVNVGNEYCTRVFESGKIIDGVLDWSIRKEAWILFNNALFHFSDSLNTFDLSEMRHVFLEKKSPRKGTMNEPNIVIESTNANAFTIHICDIIEMLEMKIFGDYSTDDDASELDDVVNHDSSNRDMLITYQILTLFETFHKGWSHVPYATLEILCGLQSVIALISRYDMILRYFNIDIDHPSGQKFASIRSSLMELFNKLYSNDLAVDGYMMNPYTVSLWSNQDTKTLMDMLKGFGDFNRFWNNKIRNLYHQKVKNLCREAIPESRIDSWIENPSEMMACLTVLIQSWFEKYCLCRKKKVCDLYDVIHGEFTALEHGSTYQLYLCYLNHLRCVVGNVEPFIAPVMGHISQDLALAPSLDDIRFLINDSILNKRESWKGYPFLVPPRRSMFFEMFRYREQVFHVCIENERYPTRFLAFEQERNVLFEEYRELQTRMILEELFYVEPVAFENAMISQERGNKIDAHTKKFVHLFPLMNPRVNHASRYDKKIYTSVCMVCKELLHGDELKRIFDFHVCKDGYQSGCCETSCREKNMDKSYRCRFHHETNTSRACVLCSKKRFYQTSYCRYHFVILCKQMGTSYYRWLFPELKLDILPGNAQRATHMIERCLVYRCPFRFSTIHGPGCKMFCVYHMLDRVKCDGLEDLDENRKQLAAQAKINKYDEKYLSSNVLEAYHIMNNGMEEMELTREEQVKSYLDQLLDRFVDMLDGLSTGNKKKRKTTEPFLLRNYPCPNAASFRAKYCKRHKGRKACYYKECDRIATPRGYCLVHSRVSDQEPIYIQTRMSIIEFDAARKKAAVNKK